MIDVSKDTFFLGTLELIHNLDYYIQNNIFIATSTVALDGVAASSYASEKKQEVLQKLKEYSKCQIVSLRHSYIEDLEEVLDLPLYSDGLKHLACAYWFDKNVKPDETVFVCSDFTTCIYANQVFGEDSIIWARDKNRPY